MALIHCPECGKDVSDTAKTCPNCGYSIQKWIKQQRKEIVSVKQEMPSAAAGHAGLSDEQVKSRLPAGRKKWFLIGGGIILAAVIALVIILLLPKNDTIETFGLKKTMNRDEIVSTMEEKGFTLIREEPVRSNDDIYFAFDGKADLFGKRATKVGVYQYGSLLQLSYIFMGEKAYSGGYEGISDPKLYKDIQGVYDHIYKKLKDRYGEPEQVNQFTMEWIRDDISCELISHTDLEEFYFDIWITD